MMKILYDDQDFAVLVKEPGMTSETLCFQDVFGPKSSGKLYCVHRLDREVGGVAVYAKNPQTAAALTAEFAEHKTEKTYLALAEGNLGPGKGEMQDLLFHDQKTNKTFVVNRERGGVKKASLSYEVLCKEKLLSSVSSRADCSLVKIRLNTGRTHQIRIQFASRKHPLLGDRRYGSGQKFEGIALWSFELSVIHPKTGEKRMFRSVPVWAEGIE